MYSQIKKARISKYETLAFLMRLRILIWLTMDGYAEISRNEIPKC